jgi:hypothetical protein
MIIVYALIFVLIALFVLSYYTRKRFGIMALALCAGALLSSMWSSEITPYVAQTGVKVSSLPVSSLVSVALILLPSLVLLYGGQKYEGQIQRIIGAVAYALLAGAFLLVPLGNSISLDEMGSFYLRFLTDNKDLIITAAIIYGLIDILIPRIPTGKRKR